MKFEKLLQENKVNESELPASIKTLISNIRTLKTKIEEEEDDDDVVELKVKLKQLDDKITDLIEDYLEEPEDEEDAKHSLKLNILQKLHTAGQKKISKRKLQELGYPVENLGKEERVGPYSLVAESSKFTTPDYLIYKK